MFDEGTFDGVAERLPVDLDRVEWAIVALVAIALGARLLGLDARVAHYDEGWVGYWTLRYMQTGQWTYRPIVHGPFLVHVNAVVFSLVGASDWAARLVVAVLGGTLPAAALLFRKRLRDDEVLVLAVLLAANPLLLYYSRFARFDVPLAAFGLVTLGLLVRLADTGHRRYAYAAAVTAALAVTTKESWLLYVFAWLGAALLLADERLLAARHQGESPLGVVRAWAGRAREVADARAHHGARATLLFLAVMVLFYAPRPQLWQIPSNPALAPTVFRAATVGVIERLLDRWLSGGMQGHPYLPYLLDQLRTLAAGAPAVVAFGVVGFVANRYRADRRAVVTFAGLAGLAFVVGMPLANFLPVPWSAVHATTMLSVPAAVGGALVVRRLRVAVDAGANAQAAVVAVLVVALVAASLTTAVGTSYLAPHESPADGGSEVVYYSQPPEQLAAVLPAFREAAGTPGPDLLYYGQPLALASERSADVPPPPGAWLERLPLPWYTEAYGLRTASATDPSALADPPPIVVTTPEHEAAVATNLDGYVAKTVPLDDRGLRTVVVFVDRELWQRTRGGS